MRNALRHLLTACLFAATALHAQDNPAGAYPNRQVRVVVPFAPGGATDYVARYFGQQLGKRLGQTFVVDNLTGAGGVIAIENVVKSAPNGYTLLVASGSYAVNPAVMRLHFDPVNDLIPVVNIVAGPASFLVNPALPVKNLAELVTYAKANPGKLVYSSAGIGNTTHIGMEAFMAAAGIKMIHSPYKGMAPALTAAAAGEAQVLLSDTASAVPLISAGKLRMLAVGGDKRLPQYPNVPTVVEAGFKEVLAAPWQGVFAPKGTPAAVIQTLNTQVNELLRSPEVIEQLRSRFFIIVGGSAEDFGATVRSDISHWTKVAREANVRIE